MTATNLQEKEKGQKGKQEREIEEDPGRREGKKREN